MKAVVMILALVVLGTLFFAGQSFQSRFFETTYSPAFSIEAPTAPTATPPGIGSPRKKASRNSAGSSSDPSGFKGPSGPPQITGPSAPPPGQ